MELADYAMIANAVPQDVKLKSANEKQMEKQDLATSALGNQTRSMQNQQVQGQLDSKAALKSALQKNTKYNPDGTSVTDHRAVANDLGQSGFIDEAHNYTINQQKQVYDAHKDKMNFLAQQAQGILSQPPEARPQAYAQAVQQAQQMGIDVTGKETYQGPATDNYLTGVIAANQESKDYFKSLESAKGGTKGPEYILVTGADGKQYKMNKNANEEAQAVTFGGQQITSPVYSQQAQAGLTTAKETAKADVERATKPGITEAVTTAKETAENTVKNSQSQKKNETALAMFNQAMSGLESGLSQTTTNAVSGRIPAVTTGAQTAEGAIAAMAPVLKGLFREAGEGTFTQNDQESLMAMLPTRKDNPDARKAKMENVRAMVKIKLSNPSSQPVSTGTAKATAESNAALAKELGL